MARDYQGDAKCDCGRDVPVYLTGGGMLTSACGWCRKQVHCPTGSASYRSLEGKLKQGANPDEPPKPSPATPAKRLAPAQVSKSIDAPKPPAAAPTPQPVSELKEKTIFDIFNKG